MWLNSRVPWRLSKANSITAQPDTRSRSVSSATSHGIRPDAAL
jgi:hypothetical protein